MYSPYIRTHMIIFSNNPADVINTEIMDIQFTIANIHMYFNLIKLTTEAWLYLN